MRYRVNFNDTEVKKRVQVQGGRGILAGLNLVLQRANIRVPIDEGTLKRSGHVSVNALSLKGNVSYDTPYAKRLHENPQYNFRHGKQGEWLRDEVNNAGTRRDVRNVIGNEMKKAFR